MTTNTTGVETVYEPVTCPDAGRRPNPAKALLLWISLTVARVVGRAARAVKDGWWIAVWNVFRQDLSRWWAVDYRPLTVREVAAAQYKIAEPHRIFRWWCSAYMKTFGVAWAAVCDMVKSTMMHPVRGPIATAVVVAGLIVAATLN